MSNDAIKPNADLRKSVTSVFEQHQQPKPDAWLATMKPEIHAEIDKAIEAGDINYQRFLINRHLRHELGKATIEQNVDTYEARFCLVENDTTETWLELFNGIPAKCIIKNGLCGMVAPESGATTKSE